MKIVHVLNHFLPHQTAGTEVYTWALVKALYTIGIKGCVVIPNYGKKDNATYLYDGIEVYQYAETSVVDRSLIMGKRHPDGLPYFEQLLQQLQPDIVHFHELAGSNGITVTHVTVAKALRIKVVMTFHLAGYTCKTGNLMYMGDTLCGGTIQINNCSACYLHSRGLGAKAKWLFPVSGALYQLGIDSTKWNHQLGTALGTQQLIAQLQQQFTKLVNACDAVVSLTSWYRQILLNNGAPKHKLWHIPQGLPSVSKDTPPTIVPVTLPIKCLFVGRISAFKGLHLLLQAIMALPKEAIRIDIYGASNDDGYAQHWQQATAAFPNITWKGTLPQQDVVPTMQQYHLLCLCSTFSEMSPLVIQEAFAAGIPVLASNVYGNAEQIQHGVNGWLFPFNNVAALTQQLTQLINEPALIDKARLQIVPPIGFDRLAENYKQVYGHLLTNTE